MATLRDYFVSESNEYFSQLKEQFNRLDASRGDPADFLRAARALRGSAQLARESRVYRAGLSLEHAARAMSAGSLAWNTDVSGRARRTIEDLESLANGGEDEDAAEARVKRVLDRWRELGVNLPAETAQVGKPAGGERSAASKQFREFAAHEVAGISGEIDSTLAQLAHDPKNRDLLKAILRRQRALLGSARLDEIGVVAETLRAIEDLVRVIHKLNVAVKDEWATVFRASRDVLSAALEPLRAGNDPMPTPALSKLRTLRTELLERYGEGEAVPVTGGPQAAEASSSTPPAPAAPVPPRPAAAAPPPPPSATSAAPAAKAPPSPPSAPAAAAAPATATPSSAGLAGDNGAGESERVVPIEELCYSGERALRRALEIRPKLETIAGDDSDAREAVDEIFDLIRLGIG